MLKITKTIENNITTIKMTDEIFDFVIETDEDLSDSDIEEIFEEVKRKTYILLEGDNSEN